MAAIDTLLARPFVIRVGWGLVHSLWQVAALAVIAAIVLRTLRRSSPQARYLVGCLSMALMGVLPAATCWRGGVDEGARATGMSAAVLTSTIASPDDDLARIEDRFDGARAAGGAGVTIVRLEDLVAPMLPALVGVWAAGVLVLSIRLLAGWVAVQRLARGGVKPVGGEWGRSFDRMCERLAVSGPVRLLESTMARVPMVVGWLRPAVLLPASALTGLTATELEAILAHELAHVRRHDYLVNLLQSVVETLLFYHPAVWWLGRRIREEREHCCDDVAVATCGDRLAYARALTAMEELRSRTWSLAPSAGGRPLLGRIRRLLGVATVEDRPANGVAGLVALASVAALGLAMVVAPGASPARADVGSRPPIVGTVLNPDGTPAVGAELWLSDVSLGSLESVVVGRGQSGAGGQFRIARRDVKDEGRLMGKLLLWGHLSGAGLGQLTLKSNFASREPDGPVTLRLRPAHDTAVRVLDWDGQPVKGAALAVDFFRNQRARVPRELAGRLGSTTDYWGRGTLTTDRPDEIVMVRITSGDCGTQRLFVRDGIKSGEVIYLRAVGRVVGRVTGSDPAAISGLKISLTSARPNKESRIVGLAETVTDRSGNFSVPDLAEGIVTVRATTPDGARERALRPAAVTLEAGRRVEVAVLMKRLVRVRGIVREKGTGTPVADVRVQFTSGETSEPNSIPWTHTDAAGRFEALALPGAGVEFHVDPPKAYLPMARNSAVRLSEEQTQTLPPIEVERGVTLRGRVVDENDKSVAGVTVEGIWEAPSRQPRQTDTVYVGKSRSIATSDAAGQFLLEGIAPGSMVSVDVKGGDARTDRPQPFKPGAGEPVTLRVSAGNVIALAGRVVDPAGRPIAGARVRISSRAPNPDSSPDPDDIRIGGSEELLLTGPDGRFQAPRRPRRGTAYSAEARAEGRLSDDTPWVRMEPATKPTLPDIVLVGLRSIHGRVVDEKGRPVAGAEVRVTGDAPRPVEARTNTLGQFTLDGVLESAGFLFVEKTGFRLQARMYGADAGDVQVSLVPDGGPVAERLTTLPPAMPRSEELRLMHRVLDPYSARVLKQDVAKDRVAVLRILFRAEPSATLELIDRKGFIDDQTRDLLRVDLVRALIQHEPGDALVQIEAIGDPAIRSWGAYEAAVALPTSGRVLKLDLLARAVMTARRMGDPLRRATQLALIGEQYVELGELGRAAEVLRDAEAIARELPEKGLDASVRGTVAECLAPLDLAGALALIRGTQEEFSHDGHVGRIAQAIAALKPAEAERLLMTLKDAWPDPRDEHAARACVKMAPVDPVRARRLANGIKKARDRVWTYGAMSRVLAPTDRPAATRLLADAFDVLDETVVRQTELWHEGAASTAAAGLLPIVEEVDPEHLRHYVWRTLALRPALRVGDRPVTFPEVSNAQVAAMVARYDRDAARTVLDAFIDRALGRVLGMPDEEGSFLINSRFTALAAVDPARAAARVETLPDESDPSADSLKAAARLAVAQVLSYQGAQRWRYLESSLLNLRAIEAKRP